MVPAGLGGLAGPAGALVLAENALLAENAQDIAQTTVPG